MLTPDIYPGLPYVPRPTVILAGAENTPFTDNITEIAITHTAAGVSRCLLRANNWGFDANGQAGPVHTPLSSDFGRALSVKAGDGEPLFDGHIYAIGADYGTNGAPSLIMRAEGAFGRLRLATHTRKFEDMRISDVIQSILSDHGMALEMEFTSVLQTHALIRQNNEDDFDFIRGLAAHLNADFWLEGSTAILRERIAWDTNPALTLTYGSTLTRFSVRADLSEQRDAVVVQRRTRTGTISASSGSVPDSLRLNGERSGPELLNTAFTGDFSVIDHDNTVDSAEDAAFLAQTRHNRRAQRFVTATGSTAGNARLKPGIVVDLWQLGEPFNGKYFVVGVRHRFDAETGFNTDFDLERADLFAQSAGLSLRRRLTGRLPIDLLRG